MRLTPTCSISLKPFKVDELNRLIINLWTSVMFRLILILTKEITMQKSKQREFIKIAKTYKGEHTYIRDTRW